MLSLYGENGLYELIEIAKKHNWQIYDSGIDGMIDLGNPEKNGLDNHKNYVIQQQKRCTTMAIIQSCRYPKNKIHYF
ncbi:hypothetical protein AAG747_19235 [Rapidithrix thailandica]|uniref:Uncharacterized protein n=1 Tax=Rapidithrix thailandica TaxID=413964 RepID=A0AAW9SC44_9BACT